MRILLVEPPISPYDIPTGLVGLPEPLALETIAAPLTANHDVSIFDMRIDSGLEAELEKFRPDIVGVSSVTANFHLAKDVLKASKASNSQILTVIGGHHVSFMPKDALEPYIDLIVLGEGDVSFMKIVEAHEKKYSFSRVPGIAVNVNNTQLITEQQPLVNMDQLLIPARFLVSKYRMKYFQRTYRPIVSINTSRGCPHHCQFCSLWKLNRGKYRVRSAQLVVDEIKQLKEEFVDFIDDNSIENVSRAKEVARLLMENKIKKKFKIYARADTIANNPELIDLMHDAGLEIALVGFETVDENKLKDWNKKCTFEMNNKAIRILQKNEVRIASYFMVDPKFNYDDFANLWKYVDSMNLMDPIFTILVPFPGTDLYESRKKDIYYQDYKMFDFFHSVFKTNLPLSEFYDQLSMLYEKSYDRERQFKMFGKDIQKNVIDAHAKAFEEIVMRIRKLKEHHCGADTICV